MDQGQRENSSLPAKIPLILILTIFSVLFIVNIIEMHKLNENWKKKRLYDSRTFNKCILPNLIIRTASLIFSFFLIVFSLFVIISFLISLRFFLKWMKDASLIIMYTVFGIYLTGFIMYALFNSGTSLYRCENHNPDKMFFSLNNLFTFILLGIIGLIIIVLSNIVSTSDIYKDSLLRKEGGYSFIRDLFWKKVFKERNELLNEQSGLKNNKKNDNNDKDGDDESKHLI